MYLCLCDNVQQAPELQGELITTLHLMLANNVILYIAQTPEATIGYYLRGSHSLQ